MYTYLLVIVLPVALCELEPDVRFDEENDRFDLTPLIEQGAYEQWGNVVGERRSDGLSSDRKVSAATLKFLKALRRFQENLSSYKSLNQSAYNEDIVSYLHGQPEQTRRSDPEVDKEVLVHHAVPVLMKVEGVMVPHDE